MQALAIGDDDLTQLTKYLQRLDFFRALSIAELDEILQYVRLYAFKSGDYIFKKGDPGDCLYVIHDGKARAFVKDSFFRAAKVLGYLNPGDVFGEMALLDGRRRSASVKTMMPTQAFVLLRSSFDMVLEANPNFKEKIEKVVKKRRIENE